MNIVHLKYAVEVEKTRSITQAAENLFIAQPNLSRAIKELEDSLGMTIFKRTSKGISITPRGEEFLFHAKKILSQIEEVESMYKVGSNDNGKFSISVPRASYIGAAFTEFTKKLDDGKCLEVFYHETNSMRAINNILQADYKPKEYVTENEHRARHKENKDARRDLVKDGLTLLLFLVLDLDDLLFCEVLVLVFLCHYYYSLRAVMFFRSHTFHFKQR